VKDKAFLEQEGNIKAMEKIQEQAKKLKCKRRAR
jgi:hypothetical protein